jgi:hypothetical protein
MLPHELDLKERCPHPRPHGQGGLDEATVTMTLVSSPPPTTDEVDRLYHQLIEIDAIGGAQLTECARWRRFDPTPSPIRAGTGQRDAIRDQDSSITANRFLLPSFTATARPTG